MTETKGKEWAVCVFNVAGTIHEVRLYEREPASNRPAKERWFAALDNRDFKPGMESREELLRALKALDDPTARDASPLRWTGGDTLPSFADVPEDIAQWEPLPKQR